MTGTLYTGDPTLPGPSQVQLTVDNDPQRATTYDAGLQNLADMIACLRAQTYERNAATAAAMVAVSDATVGDTFFVQGLGWYFLLSGSLTAQAPWIYAATGMGGPPLFWVRDIWGTLLDGGNPAKIQPALIHNAIIAQGPLLVVGSSITDSVSTSPYKNLKDDGSSDVAAVITGVHSTDKLWLDVGPIMWTVGASGTAKFRVHIVQGTTPIFYEKSYIDPGSGSHPFVQESIRYDSISTDDIQINLEIASAVGSHTIMSPTTWGSGRFEWGHYQLIRP